jgi:hypothetical protein
MINKLQRVLVILVLAIGLAFSFSCLLSLASSMDIAVIAKITINNKEQDKTDTTRRYEPIKDKTDQYLRFPVHRGNMLERGHIIDIIETFEPISARIDFTAEQYLLLGNGTEFSDPCMDVMEGKPCAMAYFKGFEDRTPFWYIKRGVALINNMYAADERAEVVELSGTEYYLYSDPRSTMVVVLDGAVKVKARHVSQVVTVHAGEQTEVFSATTPPTQPVRVSRRVWDDIYRWRQQGLIVIRDPRTGTETEQSSIQVSGTVSDWNIPTVDVIVNDRRTDRIRVVNGEFAKDIALVEGENSLQVQASTNYGESSDSISVIRKSPRIPSEVPVPNIIGKNRAEAVAILRQHGLNVGSVAEEVTGRGAVGTVVRQDPVPDAGVKPGFAVNFVVEAVPRQPEKRPVPDIVGMDAQDVPGFLRQQGFDVGHFAEEATGKWPVGTVVSQEPRPGALVPPRTSVNFTVEAAPRPPDPAVQPIGFQIVSCKSRYTARIRITGVITNRGGPFESRSGQQSVVLYEGQRQLVAKKPFQNLAPGASVNVVYERDWNSSSPSEGEFPPTYKLIISYDPDIRMDGNTKNDDTVSANNSTERSGREINDLIDQTCK